MNRISIFLVLLLIVFGCKSRSEKLAYKFTSSDLSKSIEIYLHDGGSTTGREFEIVYKHKDTVTSKWVNAYAGYVEFKEFFDSRIRLIWGGPPMPEGSQFSGRDTLFF